MKNRDRLDGEAWLARQISIYDRSIFAGDTNHESRRQRFAEAIQRNGLEAVICTEKRDGKPITYSQAFERVYQVPLNSNS